MNLLNGIECRIVIWFIDKVIMEIDFQDKWREITDSSELSQGAAIATPTGIMSLRLHDRIRVDMTIDKAIRVINAKVIIKKPIIFPIFLLMIKTAEVNTTIR